MDYKMLHFDNIKKRKFKKLELCNRDIRVKDIQLSKNYRKNYCIRWKTGSLIAKVSSSFNLLGFHESVLVLWINQQRNTVT